METQVSSHSTSEPVGCHHPKGAENVSLISLAKSCDRPTSEKAQGVLTIREYGRRYDSQGMESVTMNAYFIRLRFLWAHLEPWKCRPSQNLAHINHSSLPPWQVLWIFSSLTSWQVSPQSRLQLDLRGSWAEKGNGISRLLAQPARPSVEMEAKKATRYGGWSLGFSLIVVNPSTSLSCKIITHCVGFVCVVLMVK